MLLCSTCAIFKKTDQQASILMSREEVNQALKTYMDRNSKFEWDSISNELMYSMAMHNDSAVTIAYTPISGDKSMYNFQYDTLPEEWLNRRDKIMQYILKEERRYQKKPKLKMKHVFYTNPYGNKIDKRPYLNFKITSPFIIPKLREDPFVRAVNVYYPVEDIFFMEE